MSTGNDPKKGSPLPAAKAENHSSPGKKGKFFSIKTNFFILKFLYYILNIYLINKFV